MKPFQPLSAVDQLANHLRTEIFKGALGREMPGINQLASSLGCSPRTVIGAVKLLEREGLITKQGAGRASLITPEKSGKPPALRVQMMLYDREDSDYDTVNRYLVQIRGHLEDAGHVFSYSSKTLQQLGMDVERVSRYVKEVDTDAWIIASGSREVLKWFSEHHKPAFALFGRRGGLPIASVGPDKGSAIKEAVRHLAGLGHKRIVMLARPSRRLPTPGMQERAFLDALHEAGMMTGSYNLPAWDGTVEGVHMILNEVFRLTPPSAIIVDEPQIFVSVQNDLARRGILAPDKVSLVAADQDAYFDYLRPSVAHISYDTEPWARRITKWAKNIALGIEDRRQTLTKATFVKGDTIGPPPR